MKTGPVVMGVAAGALALLGVVLALLPEPGDSFGWFASLPVGDTGFVGSRTLVPPTRLWGTVLLVIAFGGGAFAAGWALGTARARTAGSAPEPDSSRGEPA
ncbi:hypothetical protein ROT00_03670 [Agromyces mediolanus]|uniref:hypothetical protein n=1 Tax=Agromyces mediolanus TaxID=41986 RepID=UPI003834ED3F